MHFTFDSYCLLLQSFIKQGYRFIGYNEDNACLKSCILRHDVDFDLEKASEFAKRERDFDGGNGVKATYFVLVSSPFYNIFTKKNRKAIQEIKNCGHEIGLHFDQKQYSEGTTEDLIRQIHEESSILSYAVEDTVSLVSMHRPSTSLLKMNLQIPGMINSYSETFFQKYKYVSDSRMEWREDIYAILRNPAYMRIHLLTHPIWYHEKEQPLKDILKQFVLSAEDTRYAELDDNFRNLQSVLRSEDIK